MPTTVDEYIAAQSDEARPRLRELRSIIREAVPEATESISYGMPAYKRGTSAVYFAAAKHHYALYGVPLADFASELRGYKTSKGTLQLPLDQPVPAELVRGLVLAKLQPCTNAKV
jgi:uncharacterized protein YdhG (YjbR/CyaY superfamily)